MQKDLKIGLAIGSGLAAVAVLWLATRPSLTPQARIQHLRSAEAHNETGMRPEPQSSGASLPVRQTRDEQKASSEEPRENPASRIEHTTPHIASQTSRTENSAPNIEHQTTSVKSQESSVKNKPIPTEKFYIVHKGDTLSSISHKYYGTANKWTRIFNANRETIADANKLAVGTKLIIPD